MDNEKIGNNNSKKEAKDMAALLEQKRLELKKALDSISAKASVLKTKDGMIELDPKNPQHREWFEEENKEK